MTSKDLDDLEHRLAKGWVIRPDQIRDLIAMARSQVAPVQQLTGSLTLNAQQTQYPGWSRP